MFAEELELVGYNRLNLNQFKRIKLCFKKMVQVIIGTNGSGKSSIFAELTPLPAEKNNYSKDGMKRIVYRHRGKRYILTSTFDPPKHSFIIDGELDDLNPGGTITKQRELVKQHFDVTPTTHAIVTGQLPFHRMSTDVRKDCFRLLADANFDYAIGVFNRIKSSASDIKGGLKLARNKLVVQSSKMMPAADLEALKADAEELYKIVELFIENRNTPTAPIHETKSLITTALDEMNRDSSILVKSIREVERLLTLNIVDDPKNASTVEYFVNTKLQDLRVRKDTLFTESKKFEENIELYEKTKMFQVATISTELDRLKQEKLQLASSLIYNFELFEPELFIKTLDDLTPKLLQLTTSILINEKSEKYTRDGYKAMYAERENLKQIVAGLEADIRNLDERIAHHDKHKDSPEITCPKCEHVWQPFYDEKAIDTFKHKIGKLNLEIDFKNKLISDIDFKIDEFSTWVNSLEAIKELASDYGHMRDFWSLVMNKEVVYEQPRSIGLIITRYKSDLQNQQSIAKIDEQIQAEYEKLELTSNSQGIDFNNSVASLKYINEELLHIANEESRLNSIKDSAKALAFHSKKVSDLSIKLQGSEKDLKLLVDRHVEDLRRNMFNDILRSFNSDLAIKEKAINDERINEVTIKALEDEIKALENLSEAHNLVLKELSPTEGVIAEGLFGYMKLFVRKLNRFIATVWTYPLVVQPCSSEEGKLELNYKFPLMVGDSKTIRDDIAQGSSSMREVIDLGFVVGYMKSVGLETAQLFLDEFGSAMDPIHKQQTSRMVSTIIENEKFSQIFLISHDVAQYSALDNAEVCILHEANTIIPNGCVYNKHVEFS